MKNTIKVFGIIAIIAIIGFLAACSNGDNPTVEHKHQWGDWTVTKEATCSTKGEETKVCTLDPSHKETRETAIDPDAHDWEQLEGTAPTCTTEGNGKRKCKLCGVEESGVLPALGHDWSEWVETKAPTETEDGEEERICAHDPTHKETRGKAALNHNHDYGDWFINTPATCTADGESKRVCKLNENHFETAVIEKLGHDWGDWIQTTAPTCTAIGKETRTCKHDSSHTETRDIAIDPNAHDWGNWIETTPASYIADGEETRTCNNNSSHKETRPIPQIPLVINTNKTQLASILNDLPDNTPDDPYKIKLSNSNLTWSSTGGNISTFIGANKYFSLDISDSSIESNAFRDCTTLTSVTIGNGVTSIGGGNSSGAFQGCTSLSSVIIGNGVTSIGQYAFYGCTSLTSINIPNNVNSIGDSVFNGCTSLTSINIPDNVNSIGNSAFNGCTSLTSVTIGSGVTSIGQSAFSNCTNLTSVTIGSGVTSITMMAFINCTNLTSVRFERVGTTFSTSVAASFINQPNSTSLQTAYTAGGIGTYTRPDTTSTTWTKISD